MRLLPPSISRWCTSNSATRSFFAAAVFSVYCLAALPASAACNLTATQTGTLDWGTLGKPASGSQTFDITAADATSGTGSWLYGTTPVHGSFKIQGHGSCSTITITISNAGGAAGVTLSNFHLNYNGVNIANGQSGLALGKTLKIGATATYTSAVTTGLSNPTFNVVVSSP